MAQRILTPQKTREFFTILGNPRNLDARTISKLFAKHKNTGIAFYPSDVITIGPDESPFVKPNTKTTVGIYIMNGYVYSNLKIFGYINHTMRAKDVDKVDKAMATALMDDKITTEQYFDYIDRTQWLFGGPLAEIINVSLNENIFSLPPGARKLRKELIAEHKAELDANEPQAAVQIERAVVAKAMEEMRATGDPAMDIFDSGCGIDPNNQYKTIFVMKGAIKDNTGESPTGYKVITSNYDDGITKEDMPKIADAVVTSSYASGVATQDSGTDAKRFNATFMRVRLQQRGSDCGSTQYKVVTLTEDNYEDYMYRFIKEGSKLVCLDTETMSKYIGKTVQMRTPLHCKAKNPEYCNMCVGDRIYRVGIRNLGATFMIISGSTLNAALKTKHDVSIKTHRVTTQELLHYVH